MSIASEITRINNNIASAYSKVEEKGGTLPETQNSANLATAIDSISGGGGDLEINNGTYLFYTGARLSQLENFIPYFKNLTSTSSMFSSCRNLTTVPLFDTSSVTNMSQMFYMCENLTTIPLFNTQNVTDMQYTFMYCFTLVTMPLLDTSNVKAFNGAFQYCPELTNESLNNILKMCINAVKITSNKTLKYIGLSRTQAETCATLSNYQDFLDAGWTTGY